MIFFEIDVVSSQSLSGVAKGRGGKWEHAPRGAGLRGTPR